MKKLLSDFLNWIVTWDYMAIVYSFIGSLLLITVGKRYKLFKQLRKYFKTKNGIKKFKAETLEECSNLIVVGRKKGFSLKDVFVELEIIDSDLSQNRLEEWEELLSFVLVGGPGAGKSTYVKNLVYTELNSSRDYIPLFIRLKEYDNFNTIEEFLIFKAERSEIPDAKEFIINILRKNIGLCVLDGLDEVSPQNRNKVYKDINYFYRKFFEKSYSNKLIVTCRKEAYREIPLSIQNIKEVRPLSNLKIKEFAKKWPLDYPTSKNADKFWVDLASTPKILELARSPLLLVGGLMQYTESNMGIPENRVDYLNRIADWLTVEWARAQGHPPDKYKNVYSKLLVKIALFIHKSGKTEADTNDIIKLIEKWLPNYGYESNQANQVLESLYTKTGILVRDTPGKVVFSQFSIQEYFTSRDIIQVYGIEEFVKLSPDTWWRESKLLAVAQQNEPKNVLDRLFKVDPILAAAAVAECPTSSISFQLLATKECLDGIDKLNDKVKFSAIQLLRKLSGDQEIYFCEELEKRLKNSKIASKVGIILASADTAEATKILANNPRIWQKCLKEAGYLSDSFENMLVKWIEEGNEEQSLYAANLITLSLSKERLNQLLEILPNLSTGRADHLSKLLLKYGTSDYNIRRPELSEHSLRVISKCVPFIKKQKEYLKQFFEKGDFPNFSSIPTALVLNSDFNITDSNKIYKNLHFSLIWSIKKHSIISWLAASLILISNLKIDSIYYCAFFTSAIIFTISLLLNTKRFPWCKHSFFGEMKNKLSPLILLAIGSVFIISIMMHYNDNIIIPKFYLSINSLLTVFFALYGLSEYKTFIEKIFKEYNLKINYIRLSALIFTAVVLIIGLLSIFIKSNFQLVLIIIGIIFFTWNSYLILKYIIPWRKVKKATNTLTY